MPHEPKVGELPALLPCPFCGSTDLSIVHMPRTVQRPAYHVECNYCGAQTAADDRGNHVENWNTRAEREARKDEARDSERLDWLENQLTVHVEGCHSGSFSGGNLQYRATVFLDNGIWKHYTIREALDEAMKDNAALQAEQPGE